MLEFLLLPYILPRGEEDWFEYKGRSIYLWVEPDFGTCIDHRYKYLVFTSHLNLKFDPHTTQVVVYHVPVRPSNPSPVRVIVDTDDIHKAFLGILTWSDTFQNVTFSMRPRLRKSLNDAVDTDIFRTYVRDRTLQQRYLLKDLG